MTSIFDPPMTAVRSAVTRALAEDLEPLGDVTSALLAPDIWATATVVARQAGVVAGRAAATETWAQIDPEVKATWLIGDGDRVEPEVVIATIEGPLAAMLAGERTALNFLGHLSGIASLTAAFVTAMGSHNARTRLLDTRKTTPGLRALEKAAVRAGGGFNHRGNLSEWVLLKDNHLAHIKIADAVAAARHRWPGRAVEVEADDLAQVEQAIAAGADIVLLDNMTSDGVAACIEARGAATRGPSARPHFEVSGGVTLDNIAAYAATGVESISVGAITHSAPTLDLGLDF